MGKGLSQRIIHNDYLTVRYRLYGMRRVGWDYSGKTRTQTLRHAVDRQFQFALNDVINLFLGMEMLVDCRACIEFIVSKCHVRRIKIATPPARQVLDDREFFGIDKCQGRIPALFRFYA
jgi:hypothetical protein